MAKKSKELAIKNSQIKELHDAVALLDLKKKRRSAAQISKTIDDQENRPKRKMKRNEEYLTRLLCEQGYLVGSNEIIIYDQYPLWKRPNTPNKPEKIDIVYVYISGGVWSLGVVEAKVAGGEPLNAAIEQLRRYAERLACRWEERKGIFRDLCEKKQIDLPTDFRITRLDVLAPSVWWDKQNIEKEALRRKASLEVRFLSVPDDYLKRETIEIACK